MSISNNTSLSTQYATARAVFYTQEAIALIFSTLLVLALRSAPTTANFTDPNTKAKSAFRLVLFGIGLADLLQTSSLVPYLVGGFGGCAVGAAIASTGELLSSVLTMCLSFEGYLIISKGIRDGEKKRATFYISFSIIYVSIIQFITGSFWGFGAPKGTIEGHWMWCGTQSKTLLSEMVSFYATLIIVFVVCLICYLQNEYKLRQMLKLQGMNNRIRKTLNRSRMKFLLFPLIFVVSWLPTGIHRILLSVSPQIQDQNSLTHWLLLYIAGISAEGLPIWNALFFGWFNPEAREALRSLCIFKSKNANDDEEEEGKDSWTNAVDTDHHRSRLLDDESGGEETFYLEYDQRTRTDSFQYSDLGDLPPEFVYMKPEHDGDSVGSNDDSLLRREWN